jgi:SET and MYND domain-containing protein
MRTHERTKTKLEAEKPRTLCFFFCASAIMTEEEPTFPLTVVDHGEKGRGCELIRKVQKDETVLCVAPVSVAVNDARLKDTCAFCLAATANVCERCEVVVLCANCRKPGSRAAVLHGDECGSLRLLFTSPLFQRPFKDSRTLRLVLRLLYFCARERLGTLPPAVAPEDEQSTPDVIVDGTEAITDLQDHTADMPEALLITLTETAKQLKYLVDPWARTSMDTCLALLCRYYCNAFELETTDRGWVAVGLFPSASFLNHSCVPTCRFSVDPHGFLRIFAARALPKGAELSIPYVNPAMPVERRQARLQRHFFFQCACTLCKAGRSSSDGREISGGVSHSSPDSSDEEQRALVMVSRLATVGSMQDSRRVGTKATAATQGAAAKRRR